MPRARDEAERSRLDGVGPLLSARITAECCQKIQRLAIGVSSAREEVTGVVTILFVRAVEALADGEFGTGHPLLEGVQPLLSLFVVDLFQRTHFLLDRRFSFLPPQSALSDFLLLVLHPLLRGVQFNLGR